MSRLQTQVLKLRLEPENFSAGRTAFQGLAQDAKTGGGAIASLNTNLQTVGKSTDAIGSKIKNNVSAPLQQLDKTTTSVGGKLANFGKKFAGSVANVGALGGQVFNLTRQYQDLSDTQIRVDRTSLKMSKTAEAETKARDKLNALVAQGVTGGAEYERAVLDVQQAEEAATLAVTMHGEALEDQQRAYENFAMTLAPTVVQAGGTIITMFKDLSGTKGLGGIASKVKDLVGGVGGVGGMGALTNNFKELGKTSGGIKNLAMEFGPLALAIGGVTIAAVELFNVMKRGAEIKTLQAKITAQGVIGTTPEEFQKQIDQIQGFKDQWGAQLQNIFRGGKTFSVYDEVIKSLKSEQGRSEAAKTLHDSIEGIFATTKLPQSTKDKILKMAEHVYASLGNSYNYAARTDEKGKTITAEAVTAWTNEALGNAVDKITGEAKMGAYAQQVIDSFRTAIAKGAIKQGGMTPIGDRALYNKMFTQTFGVDRPGAITTRTAFPSTGGKAFDLLKGAKPIVEGAGEAFAAFGEKATAALANVEAQMIKNANAATLLDANFKPLPQTIQQLVSPLAQAEANLKASGSGINAFVAATQAGVTTVDEWIKLQRTQIATDAEAQRTYYERAKALGATQNAQTALNITEKSGIETMQLWIQYTIAMQQGNTEAAKSFFAMYREAILAEKGLKAVTGAAKEVITYGGLVPSRSGIPKGGRSGELRVKSNYQRPLIGSPQAQLQMIAGTRPKVFARGSQDIMKQMPKVGQEMNREGDLYKQGVGKITAANKTLATSFGNMPASLLPVKNAVAALPASVQPATTATNEMSAALKAIPKVTAPKVTATVQGQSAVNQISKALANIPKTVTSTVRVKVGGSSQVAPTSRFFKPTQHGYHGTVKRPTLFMAGEGGRYEDIDVRPRGSGSQTKGGGGFHGSVNVFIGNRRMMTDIRYAVNDNQGVVK